MGNRSHKEKNVIAAEIQSMQSSGRGKITQWAYAVKTGSLWQKFKMM